MAWVGGAASTKYHGLPIYALLPRFVVSMPCLDRATAFANGAPDPPPISTRTLLIKAIWQVLIHGIARST